MRETTIEALEDQLCEARKQCQDAEDAAAELTLRAEATITAMQAEIDKSHSGESKSMARYCRSCETKRRILALLLGGCFVNVYLALHKKDDENPLTFSLFWIVFWTPVAVVMLRWRWLLFVRDYSFVSLSDNDLYRKARQWWEAH